MDDDTRENTTHTSEGDENKLILSAVKLVIAHLGSIEASRQSEVFIATAGMLVAAAVEPLDMHERANSLSAFAIQVLTLPRISSLSEPSH
jgi:hypothetical protein